MAKETRSKDKSRELEQKLGQTRSDMNELRNSMSRIEHMLAKPMAKMLENGVNGQGCVPETSTNGNGDKKIHCNITVWSWVFLSKIHSN